MNMDLYVWSFPIVLWFVSENKIMIIDMICIDNRQSVGSVDCDYTILKIYDMT